MDPKEQRRRHLKTLPIWNDDFSRVKTQIDQLFFDVQIHAEAIQASENSFELIPKLRDYTKPRSSVCKQHNDEDIVKLYRKSESGEIIVQDEPKPKTPKQQQEEDKVISTVSKSSIEQLATKPQTDDLVYAMIDEEKPWVKCRIRSVFHKAVENRPVTIFALTTYDKSRSFKVGKYSVARVQYHGENLRVPKRVIAGLSEDRMKSGIIGQEPCNQNKHRYMVLLDDGTCHYFKPDQIYPLFYQSEIPWKDLHHLGIQNDYLDAELNYFFKYYPRRTLMQARLGQEIEISRMGVVVPAIIIGIDCDTMRIVYKDRSEESIFRGCPRLNKRADVVGRLTKEDISFDKLYDKLAGNIKRYHDAGSTAIGDDYLRFIENFNRRLKVCGSNTARKSTSHRDVPPKLKVHLDDLEVTEDRRTKPYFHDLVSSEETHKNCTPQCLVQPNMKTEVDVDDIVEEFRDTSDLKVPLLLGWKRIIVKVLSKTGRSTSNKYAYITPCGRPLIQMSDIKKHIRLTRSKLDVDYFTLDTNVMLDKVVGERSAYYFEQNIAINKTTKKPMENKFISILNVFNEEELPIDFEYRDDTFPHPMLKSKAFSFNHEFKSGCDCENDCSARTICACHHLIEEAAGTNTHNRGTLDKDSHYSYKRLQKQVSTGIWECNEFCKCGPKCPNRVVQNGIRVRMQVRKTLNKGWGVFTLDDIPVGTFVCTYSAELLDDADQYGNCDMYYADLDYITIVETQKLGLDEDEGVGESDGDDRSQTSGGSKSKKRPCKNDSGESSSGETSSTPPPYDKYMPQMERYPKRAVKPARGTDTGRSRPKFKKIHKLLARGDNGTSQDYTLDARLAGNIGRFFNHSCDPSLYPQNVFISTHDLRLPVIAFFTKRAMKADDELTWNYQYTVGSVPGRVIMCECGSSNCIGRLL